MVNRRGTLTHKELQYIADHHRTMTTEEIAKRLKRNKETVEKYIQKHKEVLAQKANFSESEKEFIEKNKEIMPIEHMAAKIGCDPDILEQYLIHGYVPQQMPKAKTKQERQASQETEWKRELWKRVYWKEVKASLLSKEEETFFTEMWIGMMRQLSGNILFGEEIQLKQLIMLEVLANRAMQACKNAQERLQMLVDQINQERLKPSGIRDDALIDQLTAQEAILTGKITGHLKEYKDFLSDSRNIAAKLKTTRDERVKRVENSQERFSEIIKKLRDPAERAAFSKEAELYRKAKEKAVERLVRPHRYCDDNIDQPILTSETLIDGEKQ